MINNGFCYSLNGLCCKELSKLHNKMWEQLLGLKHRAPENYHAYMIVIRNIELQMLQYSCH